MKRTNRFFAFTLLVSGLMLLLSSLGIVSIGFGMIWPLFALFYGVYLFYQFRRTHQSDVLSPAAFFTLIGMFFFATNFFIWPDSIPWWPIFPLFWGLGNLLTWMDGGRHDNGMLLQSLVLVGAGFFILIGSLSWADTYLKFWPVILILAAIIMLFCNRKYSHKSIQDERR